MQEIEMSIPSCFQVLGLESGAGKDEIKKAYSRLVRKYHPDTAVVQNRFLLDRVIRAYRILSKTDIEKIKPRPDVRNVYRRAAEKQAAAPDFSDLDTIALKLKAISRMAVSGRRSNYFHLRQGLYDPDETVVCASIRAIGCLKIFQSEPEFSALFRKGSEKVKMHILDAIACMDGYKVFNGIITGALTDRSGGVRTRAWSMYFRRMEKRIFV